MYHQKVFEDSYEPPSLSEQEQAIYRTLAKDVLVSQIFLL